MKPDADRLLAANRRANAVEEALRLRALEELSAMDTEVLVQMTSVVTMLLEAGTLERHVRLYLDHIVAERRGDECRSFAPRMRA